MRKKLIIKIRKTVKNKIKIVMKTVFRKMKQIRLEVVMDNKRALKIIAIIMRNNQIIVLVTMRLKNFWLVQAAKQVESPISLTNPKRFQDIS